jgi:hypothetical protein
LDPNTIHKPKLETTCVACVDGEIPYTPLAPTDAEPSRKHVKFQSNLLHFTMLDRSTHLPSSLSSYKPYVVCLVLDHADLKQNNVPVF